MKKKCITILTAAVMLSGCGQRINTNKQDSSEQLDSFEQQMADQAEAYADSYFAEQEQRLNKAKHDLPTVDEKQLGTDDTDIDLTMLSGNMLYAEVFRIVNSPEDYHGKTVRAKGTFAHTVDGGKDYFAVFMADAAGCCRQGMEFELEGEHSFPDDYPAVDDPIIVEGVFDSYVYEGYTYCTLRQAHFVEDVAEN
ncbi:MAG: hypothetical protein J6M17_01625 [Ruminococcus sp.]|nr:hypothetical protein [Ruminococcus sp.]